jgi:hypothetical protein
MSDLPLNLEPWSFVQDMGTKAGRSGFNTRRTYRKIPGWFNEYEAELLYLVTYMFSGRALEIGHFLGCSTSVMCDAIHDSGRQVEFNSYDLGFGTPDEIISHYKRVYGEGFVGGLPAIYEELVFSRNTTTTALARMHLAEHGLDKYVNLIVGDFSQIDNSRYGLIFCDATHDAQEIRHNLPKVIERSADICTWAFHDTSDENAALILQYPGVKAITRAQSVGVFQYSRAAARAALPAAA